MGLGEHLDQVGEHLEHLVSTLTRARGRQTVARLAPLEVLITYRL